MTPWLEIEKSDRFLSANKADKIKIAEEWIEASDNELKTYDDYLPYHSRQLGEFGGEILKKINAEPEKEEGGFWQTIKDFGQDLKAVPQELGSGFNTTSDQIRLFGNFLQGDNEELESIYNRMNAYAPLPEVKTTVGGWVRGAFNTLPFMGASALAGVGGGFAGGAAGSAVPGIGNVAGATAGAALGSAAVGFAQGWGEMYGRLRNEGIDHDSAAGIAFAVAPVYAGIEAVQVRKIPGVAQLADKYLGTPFKRMLATKLADKAFRGKVQRALGSYAGEIISQSAEEGAQEMALNAGEQYGKNGGFENFDIGQNLGAGAEAFKESIGPFALIQAANMPINAMRNRRAQDLQNVGKAIAEGRKILPNVPAGIEPGQTWKAEDGQTYINRDGYAFPVERTAANQNDNDNLAEDAKKDPYGVMPAAENAETEMPQTKKASELFQDRLRRVSEAEQPAEIKLPLARMLRERENDEQKKRERLEQEAYEDAAERMMLQEEREQRNEKLREKEFKAQNRINSISQRIDKINDPQFRLDAMDFEAGEGNAGKLTDDQLYEASRAGYEWADNELKKRIEEDGRGTPLLKVVSEEGLKLPTPAAIRKHAQANNRGTESYLYGEIKDLYESLPANLKMKYFSGRYSNLDENLDTLRERGFNYDTEAELLSDIAENLSGRKTSYGYSLAEDDIAGMQNDELVQAHRKAFEAGDEAAGRKIAEEWLRRKDYDTKVYHGTGADGFNVALADSSKSEYGEGNQAHGRGLYMAANRDTAEAYKYNAPVHEFHTIGGKTFEEIGISPEELNYPVFGLVNFLHSNGVEKAKEIINNRIEGQTKHLKSAEKFLPKSKDGFERDLMWETIKDAKKEISNDRITLDVIDKILSKLKKNGLSISDYEYKISEGRVFDWLHNMKPEELLDEDKFLSDQDPKLQKKIIKVYRELERKAPYYKAMKKAGLWADYDKKELAESTEDGRDFYRYVVDALKSRKEANALLLKHGIRGITYNGRQDGRVFVSFEGGPAVKLQDAFTFDDNGNYIPLDKRGDSGNPDMRYSISERDEWNNIPFEKQIDNYNSGKYPSGKFFTVGTPSDLLKSYGVSDKRILMTEGVLKKIKKHGIYDEQIKNIPKSINSPVGIFSYPKNKNVFDILVEFSMPNGRPIIVSLEINKSRQGFGEIVDLITAHPKENFGRIVDWTKKGRCLYWNKEKGRKLLQDTIPANWERYETELTPFLPQASEKKYKSQEANRDWISPKMTEAPAETAEASHIKDLSHQGTVPLPKANGPTSKGSAISDSRQLSMLEESEISQDSQGEFEKIKGTVESIKANFEQKAKYKTRVEVANTLKEAREILNTESLPYNTRAVHSGDKIVIITENIKNSDEAARVFLHEQVGHWGLRKLLGADLRPFLNYVIKHYKGSPAWERIANYYKDTSAGNYAIAEEMLAHLAENRELSDPSMWNRLVAKVKRALWGNGVPQEYVNLLNEETLKSAIALSRDWAKGKHWLGADGVWKTIGDTPKTIEPPEEENADLIERAKVKNQIFDIDEAFDFAKRNLIGEYTNKKDKRWTARLSRNGLDKMNSGLARGKTNNNRLHALAMANVGQLFENSELLETEADRNSDSNVVAVHKFYAPLMLDGKMYAVKITVKEFNKNEGNRLYSIEGMDIKRESEYRGQPRGSKENSTSVDYSDSVKKFFEKLGNVNTQNDSKKYSLSEEKNANSSREYKKKRAKEEIHSTKARNLQTYVDMYSPLATLEKIVYGTVRGAEKSAWKMALMTRNLDQVMFFALRKGGIKYDNDNGSFSYRKGTKGLEEILNPVKGKNYKNFENYAKAKSAFERWEFLKNKKRFEKLNFGEVFGFTLEDAKKWIAEGSETSKKAFDELQVFFQSQRDFMLETGLISKASHNRLSQFKNYVPFFREGADLDAETEAAYERFSEIFPGGKGLSGRAAGIEKFIGSARKTKNLVENIINQTRRTLDSGYKNIAMFRSVNLMREIGMAEYVRSDSTQAKVKIAEIKRALEEQGVNVEGLSDYELLTKVPVEAYLDLKDDKNDNIISVRVNGDLRFYKVEDPELLVAVKNFGAEKVNILWSLLTAPKNLMTSAITKTPEFAARNFLRDTGSNAILFGGKTLAPYLWHNAKNAVKTAFSTEDMSKVWAAGAGGGAWYSVKAKDIAADFKDENTVKKVGKYTIKPLKWLLNKYERHILMTSEQSNRMTVMQQALENGASDMEAAFQAMDVMNFGMRGSGVWTGKNEWAKGAATAINAIIRITPFLNARIQGLYKLWRESGIQNAGLNSREEFGVKNRTRAFIGSLSKAVLMRGMMMSFASVLYSLYANNSEDDDGEKWFEKLPAHDKLNYWHFYLGNNTILRIPKPFEIGYIFGTIPEAITDSLVQKRPQTAKVLWEGFTSALQFDPLSNPVIDTAREWYQNKDSFSGRPIVQQSDKDLKPRYQYDADTSASAKAIARAFEGVGLGDTWAASPARIQNVISNFLGGMTKYATAASDVIVEGLTDIEGGTSRYAREGALKRVYDWSVRNTKTMSTRHAEEYYELRNRLREVYGAARVLYQEKRLEEVQNLIDGHEAQLGNYNLSEALNTRLNEISRKRKNLGSDKSLSNEELIRLDDELVSERNKLLADVDILLDRIENGEYNMRDFREIKKRIENAGKDKKDSKTAQKRLRELANMR